MATFWTGAALAADYGQNRVIPLGVATRPHEALSPHDAVVRREAFLALNRAIGKAVQAQLDEPPVCWLDEEDDEDLLMHCDGIDTLSVVACILPVWQEVSG